MGRKMNRDIEAIDPRLLLLKERHGTWKEVAKKLKVTERTVANWASEGIPEKMDGRVGDVMAGKPIKKAKVRKE